MAAIRQSDLRVLGYVQVKVASHVYTLPVAALPASRDDRASPKAGFFAENAGMFGIFVDDGAPDAEKRQTIERASIEAASHIARKFFN